ncbi:MAG TPA: phosphoglycerate mutase family protein [Candidatus Enterococcus avicola]|uniref:Phosphoglycerate mutase family protein n=1 Tax=Candidatus Enterococcus avicola TaxID=2838561 RepID=A0A9D2F9C6_9ENTE|nr:phosphoglycerate mutase family protein [Candidatus Enterococcus avicola]
MKQIYFLRHSIRDTTVHHEQAPLTLEGQQLAEEISAYFLDKKITQIYSSPFQRTIDTVKPTAQKLALEIQTIDLFRERSVGEWLADFDSFALQQWQDFDYKLLGGESLNDVANRVLPPFKKFLKDTNESVLICGHGTALSVLFHSLTNGQFGYTDFLKMKMPDAYQLTFSDEQLIAFENITLQDKKQTVK